MPRLTAMPHTPSHGAADGVTTTYLARAYDTPTDPFAVTDADDPAAASQALRAEEVALVVRDGVIVDRLPAGAHADSGHPDAGHDSGEVVDLREGLLIPGIVDAHVHFPQLRAIGGLGMPLLDWLEHVALPEEARLGDVDYAHEVAEEFLRGLASSGTTTALVFGSHFATAVDALFQEAERSGLRITSGQVLGDRLLRDELHTDPETARAESTALIDRWHGQGEGRLRYAVTPRFSISCTDEMLEVCDDLVASREDAYFTSHLNENPAEVRTVLELFPGATSYLDTYARHGLVGPRSVFAHNVHPTDEELRVLAERGATVAHCPTSNSSLGSGLFPLRRHLEAGVRVAMGCDVGAGTGFNLLNEGLQAYFMQQLLHEQGFPLTPAHLLHLVTSSGAQALGLGEEVGDLSVGKKFDAVWVKPQPATPFHAALQHARDDVDALAKTFVLGTSADLAGVWVGGRPVHTRTC
ncbi:guanine deaminase [Ornithinimicrobium panacihumi]|uniref:guanine deaminase n=1 Tax=Ornithinimicrobium panacihumi TaxID=2008449 RepID=UPI003F8AD93C